jgi:hypothetical protein
MVPAGRPAIGDLPSHQPRASRGLLEMRIVLREGRFVAGCWQGFRYSRRRERLLPLTSTTVGVALESVTLWIASSRVPDPSCRFERPMKYEVRCECGKAHSVSGADAGASLPCACGRTVEVPPFHLLRSARGDTAVSVLAQVRGLISNGLLPGTSECALCGHTPGGPISIAVECERLVSDRISRAEVFGCLVLPGCVGWLPALLMSAGARKARQQAIEVSVILPLPVCRSCKPSLDDPDALRRAIRQIPEYAALLDRYPNSRMVLR